MRWTVDKIAAHFIDNAEIEAYWTLGDDARRPMPVRLPFLVTREDYNRLVRFVRERLG